MGKKIGKRLFNKVVNGKPLLISEDGFLSNGYWAVRKELVEAILDKDVNLSIAREVSSLVNLLIVEPFTEQEWVLNKNVIERIERQFHFYDNVKLIETDKFYMLLDNIDENIKVKCGINKLYYDFIQRVVGSKGLMKVYAIYWTIYLIYDGKKENYDQGCDVYFVWLPHHSNDLKDLLGACMPVLLK
jgi:hypothetical protein